MVVVRNGVKFDSAKHGLIIDHDSAFEDCAYVSVVAGETAETRQQRIEQLVGAMVASYGGACDYPCQESYVDALPNTWWVLALVRRAGGRLGPVV